MKGTINLKNGVLVNGKTITSFNYDTDNIGVEDFCNADMLRNKSHGTNPNTALQEFDTSLHLYLGFCAVIAADSNIDITDLERVKGKDILEFVKIGRNFILNPDEQEKPLEGSHQSNLENSYGTTAEPLKAE